MKIVDLARDLIRLSGLEPEQDIEVKFTGIRPGEKLFEEIAGDYFTILGMPLLPLLEELRERGVLAT